MISLNLPEADIKTKRQGERLTVFDVLRSKYVALTPEEWVRQHFVSFLLHHKHYPSALMMNEVGVTLGGVTRRCDTVVYSRGTALPLVIVEYKAPTVAITEAVFRQIASYNYALRARYLFVSNGLTHYACRMDYSAGRTQFLPDIPDFADLTAE